jgi:hypothetical protein
MKKLVAAILTALMALSPLALAADLGDYPGFLGDDGVLDVYVVVGADAATADVVGAVDLAARLAAESYVMVAAGGGVSVAGGKSDQVNLGHEVAQDLKTTLDDDDIAGLQDSTITFDGDTYNMHDEVVLGGTSSGLKFQTSISGNDDKYQDNVYLEVGRGELAYYYVFDESINLTKVSATVPLEIEFLGSSLEITSVPSNTRIQAQVGTELSLGAGESATVDGKTVTLDRTSASAALVTVDGVTKSVGDGSTLTVNGLEIKVDSLFDDEGVENDFAILIVGSNAVKSYDDGDPYIGQDDDDPDWVWVLNGLRAETLKGDVVAGSGPTIGIKNDYSKDGYNDDPAGVGESYMFPGDFIELKFDSLTVADDDYLTFTMEFDDNTDLSYATSGGTSDAVVILRTDVDETLVLDYSVDSWESQAGSNFSADVNTKTIYLKYVSGGDGDVDVFYVDSDNKEILAGRIALNASIQNFAFFDYGETTGASDLVFGIMNGTAGVGVNTLYIQELESNLDTNANFAFLLNVTSNAYSHLGVTAETEEAGEQTFGGTNYGTKDENHRTYYGVILEDPESNGGSDQVVLKIPSDVVEANVIASGTGTTSSAGTSGNVKKVVPVSTAVGKLDTEISDAATVGKDLVLVGGPAVNRWTAEALGYAYPTYGADLTQITEGEGYIEYLDGVFASGQDVVVAFGWEADNTRDATSVLLQADSFLAELTGNMAVKVTDVSSAGITAV